MSSECEICKDKDTYYHHNHHIIPVELGGSNDNNNLIKLCCFCHMTIHKCPTFFPSFLRKDKELWDKDYYKFKEKIDYYKQIIKNIRCEKRVTKMLRDLQIEVLCQN